MSELEKIEQRIQGLSRDELKQFRAWFAEFDARAWDEQIAADEKAGKLDKLVSEARSEYSSGKRREI
jgi:hypothetical protein